MVEECQALDSATLESFIARKLTPSEHVAVRTHLGSCATCWKRWNRFRWDQAATGRGYLELREYLGPSFTPYFDSSWALAEEWRGAPRETRADVERFYKSTSNYLYNLVIWNDSGQRPRYVERLVPLLRRYGARRVCDFGCGVGNDGLALLESGLEVVFCDFANASTDFLRWRLKKRGLTAPVLTPEELEATGEPFDTLYLMDVIEHLPDPRATLVDLLRRTQLLVYSTEHAGYSGGRHPFHFEFPPAYLADLFVSAGLRRIEIVGDPVDSDVEVWQR